MNLIGTLSIRCERIGCGGSPEVGSYINGRCAKKSRKDGISGNGPAGGEWLLVNMMSSSGCFATLPEFHRLVFSLSDSFESLTDELVIRILLKAT